jgi:hypothetical protein
MTDPNNTHYYESGMSRRESLKWLGILAAGTTMTTLSGCSKATAIVAGTTGHWPDLNLPAITAKGYGQDPNLIIPLDSPWPRTLSVEQLNLVAILSDIIVPREADIPSASEVMVPDVVDEWVSAPYSSQQRDRMTILSVLAWIDDEAKLRFNKLFSALSNTQQIAIIDDIAFDSEQKPTEFERATQAFARFRNLVLAAFFCSPQGNLDIGYMGNVAIAGDYPGPTAEARAHLNKVLDELGLSEYAYLEES